MPIEHMTVWLVWTGQYSDAQVVGVYSTKDLAEAAAKMYPDGWVEDSYEVDSNVPYIESGMTRWTVVVDLQTGSAVTRHIGMATGDPTEVCRFRQLLGEKAEMLSVSCDARDGAHAAKVAADERHKALAEIPVGPANAD